MIFFICQPLAGTPFQRREYARSHIQQILQRPPRALVATVTSATVIRIPPTVFRRYIESLSLFHIKQALL